MNYATVRLKRLVDPGRAITYGIVQAGADYPGGVPYIRPVDMTAHGGLKDPSSLLRTDPAIARAYHRSAVMPTDIVVSIGPSFGKVMVVPADLQGANLTQGTARVAPAHGVYHRFLYWALQSTQARQHWEVSVGGATFKALNLEPLSMTPIPVAPTDEQRRIADFLDAETDTIDRLQSWRRQQSTLVTERWQSWIDGLFWESHRVNHTRVKFLIRQRPRYGVLVPDFLDSDVDGVPFIRVNDLQDGGIRLGSLARITNTQSVAYSRTIIEAGDVVLGVVGTLGRAAVADERHVGANVARAVCVLRARSGVDPALLRAWLDTSEFRQQAILATASDTAQPTLGMEDLANFRITWPTTEKQQKALLGNLAAADEWRNESTRSLRRQMDLLDERRQALITAAVTGRIDVATARGVD